MFKLNIAAVLNTQRTDKNGCHALRIRTTVKRKVKYHAINIMLRPEQWQNGEIVKHPNKAALNTQIKLEMAKIQEAYIKNSIAGEALLTTLVNANIKFYDYAERKINQWSGSQAGTTTSGRRGELGKFNEFRSNIRLKDVNNDTLTEYEDFCRSKGNINNTVWCSIKFIKRIINAAYRENIINTRITNFEGTKYVDPFRETLTPEEIAKLEAFTNNPLHSEKLRNVANWFLFSCYCGLRFGDLSKFKGFKNGKVLLQTEKTNEVVSIFATPKIIEAKERLTRGVTSNQKSNDYLKIILTAVGIDKKITFHNARHTFAVQFLDRGGRIEILSKLLGHNSIKTTEKYARISNKMADEEMKRIWG